ncbi:MAG: type I DNA topoisomerase [Lachnospiraceae bacterium]|nr:type I DNA topoisomerase [Lachnospiraceae bacterium]
MAKNLVIVESPAKAKTIKKFLGSGYEVVASQGHVRDLPKSQMGIDIEHDYEPKYITIRGKGELLASLRKEVKKADRVYLATDPDREGEAISWHLIAALGLNDEKNKDKQISRITFNEITKNAVKEAIRHPREIDMNLVDAQQARRVLDRMVGYRISPLLWAKVKRGLSAGRVQSVALRMIGDREDEINSFIPEEYWSIDADFDVKGEKKPVTAHYYGSTDRAEAGKEKRTDLHTKAEVDAVTADLAGASYAVSDVRRSERSKKPPLPFTTSTMQQEASKALNFSTQKTMRIAQQLYEGVDIAGRGTIGLITYLRTDSTRISEEAAAAAREYLGKKYGEEFAGTVPAEKKQTGAVHIQDAHEAIRPTDITLTPEMVKAQLPRDQYRLYQLVWRRFAASRMAPAKYETTQVRITGTGKTKNHVFTVSASRVKFQGFLTVYTDEEDEGLNAGMTGGIDEQSVLTFRTFRPQQHFTQPVPHYTEASLVRALEEQGIGRPSTYAPTITTILARHYVVKEDKNLYMTELGTVVNNMMKEAFPTIVDTRFTANLEALLDGVAEGKVNWKTVIENFYPDLDEAVNKAEKELSEVKVADEETDVICENCGRHMVIKYGPHGKFLACPGFPECRNTKPYFEKTGVACPKCGKDIVVKRTRKGRTYYGCMGNPECDFMVWQKPSKIKCPRCGGLMLEKGRKLVCWNEKCGYVEDMPASDEG